MATEKTRKLILDSFLALLAEKPFSEVGLSEVAARAGVSLGDLRDAYDGKIAILSDFIRRTDRAVLDGIEPNVSDESARDKLFDLIMRRLDHLAPHKAAIGRLEESVRHDPGLALCLNRSALDSARFMLAAAGVKTGGIRGAARAQGFVVMMARLLAVWREDNDPDLARTMAALDRALEQAETWSRRSDRAADALCSVARRVRRHRKPRSARPAAPEAEAV